jgi:hypothetical protein
VYFQDVQTEEETVWVLPKDGDVVVNSFKIFIDHTILQVYNLNKNLNLF